MGCLRKRTKEIGVLRSVGASKKDVKRVFTAESLIIGFLSGVFGLLVTVFLSIPITIILNKLAGIAVVVQLPWVSALILLLISCLAVNLYDSIISFNSLVCSIFINKDAYTSSLIKPS